MKESICKNEGFLFIVKFLSLFILLFYFNLFFISITARRSNALYLFLKLHFDYIDWLRYSLLKMSMFTCQLIGIKCFMQNEFVLRLNDHSGGIRMVYKCVGYGVMSFWAAFVLANNTSLLKKSIWLILGWIIIWIINCLRVTLLLVTIQNHWPINRFLDHHTLFNIFSYCLIFVLIYIFIKREKTLLIDKVKRIAKYE